jgi:hypothetical protein
MGPKLPTGVNPVNAKSGNFRGAPQHAARGTEVASSVRSANAVEKPRELRGGCA